MWVLRWMWLSRWTQSLSDREIVFLALPLAVGHLSTMALLPLEGVKLSQMVVLLLSELKDWVVLARLTVHRPQTGYSDAILQQQ